MKHLKEYNNFNPKLNKQVQDYVDQNKYNMPDLWNDELSEEDNVSNMIKYFTEYPDEMSNRQFDPSKIKKVSQNKSNSLRNYAPVLQNIGGVKDFRSF